MVHEITLKLPSHAVMQVLDPHIIFFDNSSGTG